MTRRRTAFIRTTLLFCMLLCLGAGQLFAARMIALKWSELSAVIVGHNVELALPDGNILKGRVLEVLPNVLVLNITQSASQPTQNGRTEIPRAQVTVLSLTSSNVNKGLSIGALVGIPAGIFGGKLQGVGAGIGSGITYTGIGGLIGWATHHTTTIKVLPD